MGGDGGSIPKRDDLVRNKKKAEKTDRGLDIFVKWTYCALSHLPLQKPIVSCELGRLYSKDAIIEFLLDRTKCDAPAAYEHIRGLKDIKTLQLTENPAYTKVTDDKGDAYNDHQKAPYICPVTGLEMNGRYKFCYLLQCGCVFGERAFREVETTVCHKCGAAFDRSDIIILNPDEAECKTMQQNMEQRRERARAAKKLQKTKVSELTEARTSAAAAVTGEGSATASQAPEQGSGKTDAGASKPSAAAATKKSAAGVSNTQATKRPASIQQDPGASKAFKSLFTTSSDAKRAVKTHFAGNRD